MGLRLLKAGIVSLVVLATITGSTFAYFTSSVVAAGNQIQTGSLTVAVDTTKTHTAVSSPVFGTDAFQVAIDNNGTTVLNSDPTKRFETWTSAMPGDAGFDVWIGVRNAGNGPFIFKFSPTGAWTNIRSTEECAAEVINPRTDLVSFEDFVQYSAGLDCTAVNECKNIRDALSAFVPSYSYSPVAGAITYPITVKLTNVAAGYNYFFGSDNGLSSGTPLVLNPSEFAVYRTKMKLDGTNTSDCYQSATYNWSLGVKAYQNSPDVNWSL